MHDRIRQCAKWDNRVNVQDGTIVSVQDATIESVCKMGQQSQCARWNNRVSVQDGTTESVFMTG